MMGMLRRTLALTLIFAGLVSGIHYLTKDRIAQARSDYVDRQLAAVLPDDAFDPPLIIASRSIFIGSHRTAASVYIAKRKEQIVATLIDLTTDQGYSGDIRLIIAIDAQGQIIGVRALAHRETPGLGDVIDYDKSDWMNQFQGRGFASHPIGVWRPDRLGGQFDTISSATITSTAVIQAVSDALEAFEEHHQQWWSMLP